jgi:hypothetical protein
VWRTTRKLRSAKTTAWTCCAGTTVVPEVIEDSLIVKLRAPGMLESFDCAPAGRPLASVEMKAAALLDASVASWKRIAISTT